MRVLPAAALFLCLFPCSALAADDREQNESPQAGQNSASPPPQSGVQLPRWLMLRAEHRGRIEGFTSGGFVSNRDDAYWLNRFRVNARIAPRPGVALHLQFQDARVYGKNTGAGGPPFKDRIDLRLAHADLGNLDKGRIALRVGRQELVYGEQRLVGHLNWTNTARSFDAVRAVTHYKRIHLDAFAASLVAIQDGQFNRSGSANRLYGAYSRIDALVKNGTFEPYTFVRTSQNLATETGGRGNLSATTAGLRWLGKLPAAFDYNTDLAIQRGSLGSDTVSAWAGHWLLGRTLAPRRGLRLFGEYNYASGDSNPADGTRETFDQLYPTGHDKLGLADQVGWRNVHHLRSGLELKPHPKWLLSGGYHSWWLAEGRDAMYNAGGAILARSPAGALNRHVGQELDVQATFTPAVALQIAAGYAHMFPGGVLQAATPGKTYRSPFVMVTSVLTLERK